MEQASSVIAAEAKFEWDDVGTWTALPDGRVRQYFEEARSPGTWTPWFEGFYTREVPAP